MNRSAFVRRAFTPAGIILVFVLVGGTWQFISLAREHVTLAAELKVLRKESGETGDAGKDQSTSDTEVASTEQQIANETARLEKTVEALNAAEKELPPMTGEELRTLGRMEDFARKTVGLMNQIAEFIRLSNDKSAPARDEAMARATQQFGKWTGWLEVVGQMEENPREISDLHTRAIAERLSLDAATTASIRERITSEFEQLGASGLIRPQRPSSKEEMKEWNRRRSESLHAAAARIEELIPSAQRQPWVVEQSLELGNSLRQEVTFGPDGTGSAVVAVVLPGMQISGTR